MAWIYLLFAGLLEVVWAVGMKYSEGFSRWGPSAMTLVAMILSFFLLSLAFRQIPIGTAYAIWTGIGAAGVALWGILFFGESTNALRILSLGFVLLGIAGLKFFAD